MRIITTWVPIAAVGLALLLAACASSTSTPSPTPNSTTAPSPTEALLPTATPTQAPTPTTPLTVSPTSTSIPVPTATSTPSPTLPPPLLGKPGGIITTMTVVGVPHLDVHREVQETLISLGPGISYSRLLRLKTGPESTVPQPSLVVECELCQSWEMVDHLTYRFQLKRGVRWHDISPVNGRELVAQDLVFSYNRQRTPGWPNSPLLQNIDAIEAEDSHTLKITLKPGHPNTDVLLTLADGHSKVIAEESLNGREDLKEGPVIGTGPWIWDQERSREDVGSVFVKNPDYFEKGLPYADELIIRLVQGEEVRRLAAFLNGAVDIYRVPPESWDRIKQSPEEFNSFLSLQSGSGLVLSMNVSSHPFDKLKVRKAVFSALDPWEYLRKFWAGQGFISLGVPVERPDWLLTRDEMRGTYFGDPSQASELLANSGLTMPVPLNLTVADYGDNHVALGERIEQDLRSVGFDPQLTILNPSQYTDRVWRDKKYQLSLGVLPPTTTINGFLFPVLHGKSGRWNLLAHSDSQLDAMIDQQALEYDPSKRRDLLRQIQSHLLEQAYLFSPVSGSSRWVFASNVRGFYPNTAVSEYGYWARTWVEG